VICCPGGHIEYHKTLQENFMTDSTVEKKQRGAKRNPNSAISKTYEIIKNLPVAERTRSNVLSLIGVGTTINLQEKVASVYYYNTMKKIRNEAATSTVTA
jgi:hypothetical protein